MKLAVALADRANLQSKLSELEKRLYNNAKVQEGDTPSENPMELLKEISSVVEELDKLIRSINIANSKIEVNGATLTSHLAKRDSLKNKYRILRNFLDSASNRIDRYSSKEIKILSTVDVKDIQKEVDDISKNLRLLEDLIQEANWTTEIELI